MKKQIGFITNLQSRVKGKSLLIAPAHERSFNYARHLEKTARFLGYYDGNESKNGYRQTRVYHSDDLPGSGVEVIVITSLSFADAIAEDINRVLPHVEIIKIKDLLSYHQREEIQKRSPIKRKIEAPTKTGTPGTGENFSSLLSPLIQWFDSNGKAGYDPYDFEDYLIQNLKTRYHYLEGTPRHQAEQWKKEVFDPAELNDRVRENQHNPKAL